MQLHGEVFVPAGHGRGHHIAGQLGVAHAIGESRAHQADGARDVGGGHVDAARAVAGVVLPGAEEVVGEFIPRVQPQRAGQPDSEEAAALFQVAGIGPARPAQHGSRLRRGFQVVIGSGDHLRRAAHERLDRARHGPLVDRAEADEAQHAPPLCIWLRQ